MRLKWIMSCLSEKDKGVFNIKVLEMLETASSQRSLV